MMTIITRRPITEYRIILIAGWTLCSSPPEITNKILTKVHEDNCEENSDEKEYGDTDSHEFFQSINLGSRISEACCLSVDYWGEHGSRRFKKIFFSFLIPIIRTRDWSARIVFTTTTYDTLHVISVYGELVASSICIFFYFERYSFRLGYDMCDTITNEFFCHKCRKNTVTRHTKKPHKGLYTLNSERIDLEKTSNSFRKLSTLTDTSTYFVHINSVLFCTCIIPTEYFYFTRFSWFVCSVTTISKCERCLRPARERRIFNIEKWKC